MPSIPYQRQPFFKSCGLLSTRPIIKISNLSNNFMCAHPHYILACFSTQRFHNHFIQVQYMTWRSFGQSIVRFNTSLHFLFYFNSLPYLCFSFHSLMIHILLALSQMWYLHFYNYRWSL